MPAYPQQPTFPVDVRSGRRTKVRRVGGTGLQIDIEDGTLDDDVLAAMPGLTFKANPSNQPGQPRNASPAEVKQALAVDLIDNTPDAEKPISVAQQQALNAKLSATYTDGLGGDAPRLIQESLRAGGLWLHQFPGVVGDGLNDDTVGVQAAFNVATTFCVPILVHYNKRFRLTATVTASGGPLILLGFGCDTGNLFGVLGKGSWFFLDHLGVGFRLQAQLYSGQSQLLDIGTYRNQAVPTNYAWQPLAADYDVVIDGAEAIIDMTMANATKGLRVVNNLGNRLWLRRLRGQFFNVGVSYEQQYDVPHIGVIHAWPFWVNNDFANKYTATNGTVLYARRADGLRAEYVFGIFYKRLIRLGSFIDSNQPNPLTSVAEGFIQGAYADLCCHLLTVDADVAYANISFGWATHLQENYGTAGNYGIECAGANVSIRAALLKMNGMRGGFGYLDGLNSQLCITEFHEGAFNRIGNATGFVAVNGATVEIVKYKRANPVQTVFGTAQIPGGPAFTPPNNNAPRAAGDVTAILSAGAASGVTDASGNIVFSHFCGQIPNHIAIRPRPVLGSFRIIAADAATITFRALDNNGTVIGSGVTIIFTYEAGVTFAPRATTAFTG